MPEILKSALCSWLYPVYDADWWQPDCPIGSIFAENILQLLGTDPDVMHLSLPYVQWMLAGSPLIFILLFILQFYAGLETVLRHCFCPNDWCGLGSDTGPDRGLFWFS